MKVRCPHCKYSWNTKSEMIEVTCPSCHLKIKKEKNKVKEKDAKVQLD